jgi:hypothetical protein
MIMIMIMLLDLDVSRASSNPWALQDERTGQLSPSRRMLVRLPDLGVHDLPQKLLLLRLLEGAAADGAHPAHLGREGQQRIREHLDHTVKEPFRLLRAEGRLKNCCIKYGPCVRVRASLTWFKPASEARLLSNHAKRTEDLIESNH